jgi:hypothetical protein
VFAAVPVGLAGGVDRCDFRNLPARDGTDFTHSTR